MHLTRVHPLLLVAALGLAGCAGSGVARTFGLQREAPDEFTVTARAPLSMPPNYMLQPPRPGASRPQELSSRNAAEATLVPQAALAGVSGASPGEAALVQAAGPPAPADIRTKVDQQASIDDKPPGFTDKLMFWRTPPEPGVTVDAQKEAQRLRENAALGQPGADTPTSIIKPRSKSIFSNWF